MVKIFTTRDTLWINKYVYCLKGDLSMKIKREIQMRQRIFNYIISLCNLIGIIGLIIIAKTVYDQFGGIAIDTSDIRLEIEDLINTCFYSIFIILIIVNSIYSIMNRKNKELMLAYATSAIVLTFEAIAFDMEYFITSIFLDYIDVPWEIEDIYIIATSVISVIMLLLLVIVDIVRVIKNGDSKKKIILYVLMISVLVAICYFAKIQIVFAVIIFLAIMQMMNNGKALEEKEKKSKIILNIFLVLFITISVIGIIINIIYTYQYTRKIDLQMTELAEQIQDKIKKVKKDEQIIVVQDNEKGAGAINLKGIEVIPCGKYNDIIDIEGYDVLLAWNATPNQYIYLNKDGTEIASCDNAPTPWMADDKFSKNISYKDAIEWATGKKSFLNANENKKENEMDQAKEEYQNGILIQKYKLNNSYIIKIEYDDDEDTENVNIKIIDENNNIISEESDANVILESDSNNENVLKTFSDGSVPFYNINNKSQGWFDAQTGKKYTLKGNVEILDVIEDKVLIRHFDNDGYVKKESIINKEGKTLINAKEVHELENGFIIKNSNDKYVYINSDLEIKTEEFDYINGEYSEYGVLICKNNAETDSNYEQSMLIDTDGNNLMNRSYEDIGSSYTVETNYLLDDEIYILFE